MSFTDEDLKRLKKFRLQGYHTWTAFEQNEIVDLVDALLARLEAAENVCHKVKIEKLHDGNYAIGYTHGISECLQTWRKAAGK